MLKHTIAALLLFASCNGGYDPVAPSAVSSYDAGPCIAEAAFCAGRVVQPLDAATVRAWQDQANDYADAHYGVGKRVYPTVHWMPCFFPIRGICAAGYTQTVHDVYVSTAQDWRTGPLVAHEVLHAVYWARFGDPDATHTKRAWGW